MYQMSTLFSVNDDSYVYSNPSRRARVLHTPEGIEASVNNLYFIDQERITSPLDILDINRLLSDDSNRRPVEDSSVVESIEEYLDQLAEVHPVINIPNIF